MPRGVGAGVGLVAGASAADVICAPRHLPSPSSSHLAFGRARGLGAGSWTHPWGFSKLVSQGPAQMPSSPQSGPGLPLGHHSLVLGRTSISDST